MIKFDISFHADLMFSTNPNFSLTASTFSVKNSSSGTKSALMPSKIKLAISKKALLMNDVISSKAFDMPS